MPQPVAADKTALSVGEIARRCDIPVSTVHFYEAEGLIRSWRNNANHRRYSRHVLRRIAVIKVAQRTGITLREIKQALAVLPEDSAPTAAQWQAMSRQWQALLQQKIADLNLLQQQLDSCIGCGCLSLADCPLRNPGDCRAEGGTFEQG
ncbi:redox-sensitive transcriptional activator SoxR [Thalassolituus pacificus]|uniref:Redox-sensitive transcriptional activator SoxR n=1 Tax=Thalassolituus pacificus TaxID=2975440 RepID=A0A9X2WHV6_9GAMM|nr:redox-sensitive transcriptional activator SoxR [Thalassolituus pacificus]MCT7360643.1 redox-sensitive transcriptional activator SoxR [Thalassolituus pacificus]